MTLPRNIVAEGFGTAILLAIFVVRKSWSNGNDAITLLGNTVAAGAGMIGLIQMIGAISGAHFNPAVTLAMLLRRETTGCTAVAYVAAQIVGGVSGVWAAHAMFAKPIWQISSKLRACWYGEPMNASGK